VIHNLIAFTVAITLLAVSPGPASALVIQQTLKGGRRFAVLSILGIATGLLAWLVAAVFGLSVLVARSPHIYGAIRLIGAVFLILIGVRALVQAFRKHPVGSVVASDSAAGPASGLRAYQVGLVTCLTNPKVAVFVAAILPQFVPAGNWSGWVVTLYAAVWVASSSGWYLLLSFLLSKVRWIFERPVVRRRLELVTGLVILGLGLRLAADVG
jgi:threonine/homoserine/homoserine lactone efflux protein